MGKKLFILGAGGHGRVCAEVAAVQGYDVLGFVDAQLFGQVVNGIPVVSRNVTELSTLAGPNDASIFVAIGSNEARGRLFREARGLGYEIPTLIHPSACVSPTVIIGDGTAIIAGAVINANSRVGSYCIVNTSSSLDHDNSLADGVQICPGVRSAGAVQFGEASFIGTGASIIPGTRIGARATVGAGAVVIKDVPDNQRVVGNPARPLVSTRLE